MISKNNSVTFERSVCGLCIIVCCIYIFFWENKYVYSGITFAAAGILATLYLISTRFIKVNISARIFIVIVSWNFLGLLYLRGDFYDAVNWIVRLVLVFVIFLAFTNSELAVETIIKVFALIALFFVIGVISEYFKLGYVDSINSLLLKEDSIENNLLTRSWGFYAGFSGYNIVSAIMAMMLLFITLAYFYYTNKKGIKIACISMALISFITIIITQKRGIFVASLVAIVVIHWIERMHKKGTIRQLVFFFLIIITIIVAYLFLQSSTAGELFLRRFTNSTDISNGRFTIARTLLSNWVDYFLIGNGPSATKMVYEMNAHNNYLQIFYENGIIGLVLYLVFFFKNLRYTFQRLRKSKQDCAEKYTIFLTISIYVQISFLIYSFFGNPMNDLYIFLIYVIFAALPFSNRIRDLYVIKNN